MSGERLTPTMLTALRTVASKDPQPTAVSWKTGPHHIASGTAKALDARGLVTYRFNWHTAADVTLTDAGRAYLAGAGE